MSQVKTNSNPNRRGGNHHPDAEVVVRTQRRRFSAAYKLRILQEADACQQPGEIGALLRREGLYSSHLTDWRRERNAGVFAKLDKTKRGRPRDEVSQETVALRQENAELKAQLTQTELIISAQKKLAQLLEQSLRLSKETP